MMNCEIENLESRIQMKQQQVASMESHFRGMRLDLEEVLHLAFEIQSEEMYIRHLKRKLHELKKEKENEK